MLRVLALLLPVVVVSLAQAQEGPQQWPVRPVRFLVPFPPGGSADALPRIVGERLSARFGQPFVVENRPGATGAIAGEILFRAEPDGYTFMSTPPAPLVINPSLFRKLPYDPAQFVPVSVMASIPSVLLVHPKVAAGSVKDLVAFIQQNPGRLNYASQGTTSVSFLTTEMFLAAAGGLKVQHVPYKGTGPALVDTLSGQVQMLMGNVLSSLQHAKTGKLRVLGVSTAKRSAALPAIPTIAEAGVPGYESSTWHGWFAPAATPPAVINKVSAELAKSAKAADVLSRLQADGAEPVGSSPEQLRQFVVNDIARWRKVVRDAGIRLE